MAPVHFLGRSITYGKVIDSWSRQGKTWRWAALRVGKGPCFQLSYGHPDFAACRYSSKRVSGATWRSLSLGLFGAMLSVTWER